MDGMTYIFKGTRPGFDFSGSRREDCGDGYTNFRKADGTVHAVVMTCLLAGSEGAPSRLGRTAEEWRALA